MVSTCLLNPGTVGVHTERSSDLLGASVTLERLAVQPFGPTSGMATCRGGCCNPNIIQLVLTQLCSAGTSAPKPKGKMSNS